MNKKNIISTFGISLLAAPLLFGCASNQTQTDFEKMRDAYKEYIMTSNQKTIDANKDKSAAQLIEELKLKEKKIGNYQTYYIDGLQYEFDTDRNNWPAGNHVSTALKLAYIGEARGDNSIKELARKMTYYWVFNNYRCTNWWHNHLGAGGNTLSSLGLFVYDDLTDQGKVAMLGKISDASLYYHPSLLTHTGANLFDYADITLKESIISRNEDEFETAVARVEEEVTDKNLEGFQTDGSFFQHGQQVQIASYGKGVKRLGNVLRTISKSSRKFNAEKLNIVDNYLMRGLRSMTHKGYLNYSAMSRELVRRNNISADSNGFSEFATYTELPDYPNKEGLKGYLDSISGKTASLKDGEIVYFNKAKMVAANIGGVYMSFKGTAPNLTNTECVNDENELGLNLSYGTNTCVMDDGDDYFNISPLWDYAYIPGTTTYNINDESNGTNYDYAPEAIDSRIIGYTEGEGDDKHHVDGIRDIYVDQLYERQLPAPADDNDYVYSDGSRDGVTVLMQRSCHHDENYFTVTCIMCEDGMVLLGADLKYDGSITGSNGSNFFTTDRTLHTTIDQSRKTGTLGNDNKTYTRGNVVYKSLDDHTFIKRTRKVADTVHINEEEGENAAEKNIYSWKRNSPQTTFDLSKRGDKETYKTWFEPGGDIDTVFIEHGNDGATTACKYAYSIQPVTKIDKTFEILKNFDDNKKVQEVKLPNGKTVVIAYQDYEYSQDVKLKKGEFRVL